MAAPEITGNNKVDWDLVSANIQADIKNVQTLQDIHYTGGVLNTGNDQKLYIENNKSSSSIYRTVRSFTRRKQVEGELELPSKQEDLRRVVNTLSNIFISTNNDLDNIVNNINELDSSEKLQKINNSLKELANRVSTLNKNNGFLTHLTSSKRNLDGAEKQNAIEEIFSHLYNEDIKIKNAIEVVSARLDAILQREVQIAREAAELKAIENERLLLESLNEFISLEPIETPEGLTDSVHISVKDLELFRQNTDLALSLRLDRNEHLELLNSMRIEKELLQKEKEQWLKEKKSLEDKLFVYESQNLGAALEQLRAAEVDVQPSVEVEVAPSLPPPPPPPMTAKAPPPPPSAKAAKRAPTITLEQKKKAERLAPAYFQRIVIPSNEQRAMLNEKIQAYKLALGMLAEIPEKNEQIVGNINKLKAEIEATKEKLQGWMESYNYSSKEFKERIEMLKKDDLQIILGMYFEETDPHSDNREIKVLIEAFQNNKDGFFGQACLKEKDKWIAYFAEQRGRIAAFMQAESKASTENQAAAPVRQVSETSSSSNLTRRPLRIKTTGDGDIMDVVANGLQKLSAPKERPEKPKDEPFNPFANVSLKSSLTASSFLTLEQIRQKEEVEILKFMDDKLSKLLFKSTDTKSRLNTALRELRDRLEIVTGGTEFDELKKAEKKLEKHIKCIEDAENVRLGNPAAFAARWRPKAIKAVRGTN